MFYSVIYLIIKLKILPLIFLFRVSVTCCCGSGPPPLSLEASAVRNLRLVSFEAAEGPSCCSRLCDPVAPADAFKFPLSHHFHGDSDLSIVSSLCWAAKPQRV